MKSQSFKRFIFPAALLLILLIVFGVFLSTSSKLKRSKQRIHDSLSTLQSYFHNSKRTPNLKGLNQVSDFQTQLETLRSKILYRYENMLKTDPPLNPLEFKKKLQSLNQHYSKLNIPFPIDLGFKEFEGGVLPSKNQIKLLSRQLSWITTLMDLFIAHKAESITEIKRLPLIILDGGAPAPDKKRNQKTKKEKTLFNVYRGQFSFKMNHSHFVALMKTLMTSNQMLKIEKVSLQSNYEQKNRSLAGQLISINLHLSLTEIQKAEPKK